MEIKKINSTQLLDLKKITPSFDNGLNYYPCQVELINGDKLDNVYVVDCEEYLRNWGMMPDLDRHKKYILIENVEKITDSPNRLPYQYANKIYNGGELGMGYCIFKIIFDNLQEVSIVSGNAVDFVPFPKGLAGNNITDVLPNEGSRKLHEKSLDFYWCLFKRSSNSA